jgi:hypothetical protein
MALNTKQFISFSSTREVGGQQLSRLQPRRLNQAIRRSLVSAGGLIYPNLQAPSMWTDVDEDDGVMYVTFTRRKPVGDLRLQPDGSYLSTRELLDDEIGPIVFLEALTWELLGNMMFFSNLTSELGLTGTYRIALSLGGFDNAQVDWAGFSPSEGMQRRGFLLNWRFHSAASIATFEADAVRFPVRSRTEVTLLNTKIADVIGDFAYNTICVYRPPSGAPRETRLELDEASIQRVIRAARQRIVASETDE